MKISRASLALVLAFAFALAGCGWIIGVSSDVVELDGTSDAAAADGDAAGDGDATAD